jgi:gliding motility-associated lipoprotein GldB
MRFFIGVFIVLFFFLSCNSDKKKKIDVSNIDVSYSIDRFDKEFYSSTKENLGELKKKYPFFFSEEITDSITVSKITNKDEQELFRETQKLYADFSSIEKQLTSLFKHVKFYNSKFVAPKVITMLTNIDYESRVIYADSLLIISLDVYLGKNHPFYADYPKYIKENNTKNHLIVDIANTIIAKQLPPNLDRSFLGKMMYEGKKLYLLDLYLPEIKDKEKVGYEKEKLDWAEANEEQIWMFFIEKKLLFSTDTKLKKRCLDTAPFSKFYKAQYNLSPGRIGVWVGWQIVRSYMQHNTVSLQELLETNTIDIYKKSKYKPKK